METLGLTGSDLPEIGDKTAVSKVLNGDRPISHKMAYALAQRFAMEPGAFVSPAPTEAAHLETARPAVKKPPSSYRVRSSPALVSSAKETGAGEYKEVVSKGRKKTVKTQLEG